MFHVMLFTCIMYKYFFTERINGRVYVYSYRILLILSLEFGRFLFLIIPWFRL